MTPKCKAEFSRSHIQIDSPDCHIYKGWYFLCKIRCCSFKSQGTGLCRWWMLNQQPKASWKPCAVCFNMKNKCVHHLRGHVSSSFVSVFFLLKTFPSGCSTQLSWTSSCRLWSFSVSLNWETQRWRDITFTGDNNERHWSVLRYSLDCESESCGCFCFFCSHLLNI